MALRNKVDALVSGLQTGDGKREGFSFSKGLRKELLSANGLLLNFV